MTTTSGSSRIEVLGVYSLRANHEQYERCVAEHVAVCDPANLSPSMREFFIEHGRDVEPLTEDEKLEAEVPIRLSLQDAVYVEALIHNGQGTFSANDFIQPDPELPRDQWQVAWNPTYLALDGNSAISGLLYGEAPPGNPLRMVFTLHCRSEGLSILSSYGPLSCPPTRPAPDRLWQLVPYETVD